MKRWLFVLFLLALPAFGQVTNPNIVVSIRTCPADPPVGACATGRVCVDDTNNAFYACIATAWQVIGTIGADAGTLDGIDSLNFMRSNVSDTFNGTTLTIDGSSALDLNGDSRTITFGDTGVGGTNQLILRGVESNGGDTMLQIQDSNGIANWLRIDINSDLATPTLTFDTNIGTGFAFSDNIAANNGFSCTNCIDDSDVVNTITASNYLALAGGTMTGSITSSQNSAIDLSGATTPEVVGLAKVETVGSSERFRPADASEYQDAPEASAPPDVGHGFWFNTSCGLWQFRDARGTHCFGGDCPPECS